MAIAKKKITTNAKTTANTVTTKTPAKKAGADLTKIRANFDGLRDQVHSLPEGKQKAGLLNALESVYVDIATAWKRAVGGPTSIEA